MSPYAQALKQAMELIAARNDAIFLGQAVSYPGTAMSTTLVDIPPEKKIELPVFEETQLGMSIGLSLAGFLPVSIFPRWNFLLAATNQLVNHLDKFPFIAKTWPKILIRVGVATPAPLHPGPQHLGDFSVEFGHMLQSVFIDLIDEVEDVLPAYRSALERVGSTILVERMKMY